MSGFTARRRDMMAKLALFLVLCGALALAGCQSGTLVDEEQTCESSGALFVQKKATCNGSVGAVRGSPQLAVVDTDGNLEGSYRLEATVSVGRGRRRRTSARPAASRSAARSLPATLCA